MENRLGFIGKVRYCETMGPTVEDILVKKTLGLCIVRETNVSLAKQNQGSVLKNISPAMIFALTARTGGGNPVLWGNCQDRV